VLFVDGVLVLLGVV